MEPLCESLAFISMWRVVVRQNYFLQRYARIYCPKRGLGRMIKSVISAAILKKKCSEQIQLIQNHDKGAAVKRVLISITFAVALILVSSQPSHSGTPAHSERLGFDRNEYPGDDNLPALRQTFDFAGYWLNNPPGMRSNSWIGKRKIVQSAGFGFIVIFNGRTYAQIKAAGNAARFGNSDATDAVAAARREGFPPRTIIFLDQEQGGRLLEEQRAYLHAWVDAVNAAGFRSGVYCSGIAAKEAKGSSVITAEDIRQNAGGREITYWVTNDSCPPSPGCTFPRRAPSPQFSGISFAEIWQYAQSPKRSGFASHCANYNRDRNCYAPGIALGQHLHLDLNVATSSDPSHGRTPKAN